MLSLGTKISKESKPIAYVREGEHNNKVIWLTLENLDMTLDEQVSNFNIKRLLNVEQIN
jgi:hypothetical protein